MAAFLSSAALAANVEVSPVIIDWRGQHREDFSQTFRITNVSSRPVTVWPYVGDLDTETGALRMPSGPGDGHDRFSTWVKMRRTEIWLRPGATKEITAQMEINIHAPVGTYYGVIAFPEGQIREKAFENASSAARATVTVSVFEEKHERLNIIHFSPLKRFAVAFPVVFDLQVGNGGDIETPIEGRVRFFDRHDDEVGEVVLAGEHTVMPDTTIPVGIDWSGDGGFGRHKALIELTYGTSSSVTDVTFFWVIPWQAAMVSLVLIMLVVGVMAHLITRSQRNHA